MNGALSILEAARDAGDRVALIAGGKSYRYAELAQLTAARMAALRAREGAGIPLVVEASSTLDTVVSLYAALELGRPFLPLHPRLPPGERESQLNAVAGLAADPDPEIAAIVFTSGTTGAPRGALLTRAALLASAQASAANLGWNDDDNWLLCMSLARIGGLSIITRCLAARRAFTLAPAFRAEALPGTIETHRITLASLVPTMLSLVLDAHPRWRAPPYLRTIQLGGSAASPRLLQRARERDLPIMITYGMTETCSQIVATPYAMRFDAAACGAGTPLAAAQVRVIDGRIEVKGPMRMRGYAGEPALDAAAWFDTGDLGEIDGAGCLHVHARSADAINSGGEKILPLQVERVLETCPGILAAGVFGIPDETWGEIVAAALVVAEPASPVAGLTEAVAARLAPHIEARLAPHKRPRRWFAVERLPYTAAGKLDRAALCRLALDGAHGLQALE